MKQIFAEALVQACADDAFDSGITMLTTLEPLGGPGSPVKPAVYAGGVYQLDRRWHGEGDEREVVEVAVIDNVPSQANRLEAAMERLAPELGLPSIVLDISDYPHLPPHAPRELSSFRFPHRNGDAYLRDSELDGQAFLKTAEGKAIFDATGDNPTALAQWTPQALLLGYWQSHLGKKGSQSKLARSLTSEIVGYRPAATDTRRFGLKGDPLNLSIDDAVKFDGDDLRVWEVLEGKKKGGGQKSKESLAEVGHGQVPIQTNEAPLGAMSFDSIEQLTTVSFAGLRNITAGNGDQSAALRAMLVALGVVAHVAAFGRGFTLRSGAELNPVGSTWTWLGETGREALARPTMAEAKAVFADAVALAEKTGLPVGTKWATEPLRVVPNKALATSIAKTFPELGE